MDILEYPLDNNYIILNKNKIKKELLKNKNFILKKVAILSGSTIGEIKDILELFLLNYNIKPIFYIGSYNRIYEESCFDNKLLKDFAPDVIYIHSSNKNLEYFDNNKLDTKEKIRYEYNKLEHIWDSLEKRYSCPIIQNNFELFLNRVIGNSDCFRKEGGIYYISVLNQKIYEYAQIHKNFFINDINYLSSYIGLNNWYDNSNWYLYKYSLSIEAIPTLCYNISKIVKSIFGLNKKSIILDLDNTIWGGIIGEVGVESIEIGDETPLGQAFEDFQKYLKKLSELGIILNVCSKNDENIAKGGFKNSKNILKIEDFICFKANWQDKYKNIMEILKDLNILEESIVFIDDNKIERDIVKQFIPKVSVPNISSPQDYINDLDKKGYFEFTFISEDDINRNKDYKVNITRNLEKLKFDNFDEYLKSLNMFCSFEIINKNNLERVLQLINKTNQFNFTLKKYSLHDLFQIIKNNEYIHFAVRLKDKFGDNGLVSVIILKVENKSIYIDLWVMSCRVFKRDLEYAIFDKIIDICRSNNISHLIGNYIFSDKNQYIKKLYKNLGFNCMLEDEFHSLWEYNVPQTYISKNKNITYF